MKDSKYKTFQEFWPFYLTEHTHPMNRQMHFIGTTLALLTLTLGLSVGPTWLAWCSPIFGYFFAWIGHFKIQKNKPATFQYPFYSLMGDFKLYFYTILGRVESEYQKIESFACKTTKK